MLAESETLLNFAQISADESPLTNYLLGMAASADDAASGQSL